MEMNLNMEIKEEGDQKCVIKKIVPIKKLLLKKCGEKSVVFKSLKTALGNMDIKTTNGTISKMPLHNSTENIFKLDTQKVVNNNISTPIIVKKPVDKIYVQKQETKSTPPPKTMVIQNQKVFNDPKKMVQDKIQERIKELVEVQKHILEEPTKRISSEITEESMDTHHRSKTKEIIPHPIDGILPNGDFLGFPFIQSEIKDVNRKVQLMKKLLLKKYRFNFDKNTHVKRLTKNPQKAIKIPENVLKKVLVELKTKSANNGEIKSKLNGVRKVLIENTKTITAKEENKKTNDAITTKEESVMKINESDQDNIVQPISRSCVIVSPKPSRSSTPSASPELQTQSQSQFHQHQEVIETEKVQEVEQIITEIPSFPTATTANNVIYYISDIQDTDGNHSEPIQIEEINTSFVEESNVPEENATSDIQDYLPAQTETDYNEETSYELVEVYGENEEMNQEVQEIEIQNDQIDKIPLMPETPSTSQPKQSETSEKFNIFKGNYSEIDRKLALIGDYDESNEEDVKKTMHALNSENPESPESHLFLFLHRFLKKINYTKSIAGTFNESEDENEDVLSEKPDASESENSGKANDRDEKSESNENTEEFKKLNEKYEILKANLRTLYESMEIIENRFSRNSGCDGNVSRNLQEKESANVTASSSVCEVAIQNETETPMETEIIEVPTETKAPVETDVEPLEVRKHEVIESDHNYFQGESCIVIKSEIILPASQNEVEDNTENQQETLTFLMEDNNNYPIVDTFENEVHESIEEFTESVNFFDSSGNGNEEFFGFEDSEVREEVTELGEKEVEDEEKPSEDSVLPDSQDNQLEIEEVESEIDDDMEIYEEVTELEEEDVENPSEDSGPPIPNSQDNQLEIEEIEPENQEVRMECVETPIATEDEVEESTPEEPVKSEQQETPEVIILNIPVVDSTENFQNDQAKCEKVQETSVIQQEIETCQEIAEKSETEHPPLIIRIPLTDIKLPTKHARKLSEDEEISDSSDQPIRKSRKKAKPKAKTRKKVSRSRIVSSEDEDTIVDNNNANVPCDQSSVIETTVPEISDIFETPVNRKRRANLRETIVKTEPLGTSTPVIVNTYDVSTIKRKSRRGAKPIEKNNNEASVEETRKEPEIIEEECDSKMSLPYSKILDLLLLAVAKVGRNSKEKKLELAKEREEKDKILRSNKFYRCGRCQEDIVKSKWLQHVKADGGLSWMEGLEPPLVYQNYQDTLRRMNNMMRIYGIDSLICKICGNEKRSAMGFLSHIYVCGKSPEEQENLKIICKICGTRIFPFLISVHKNSCRAQTFTEVIPKEDVAEADSDVEYDNSGRTKRRAVKKAKEKMKQLLKILDNPGDYINHRNNLFYCMFCGASFQKYNGALEHVKDKHDESEKNQLNLGDVDDSSEVEINDEGSSSDDGSSGVEEHDPSSPSENEIDRYGSEEEKVDRHHTSNNYRSQSRLSVISAETPEMGVARKTMQHFINELHSSTIQRFTIDGMKNFNKTLKYNLPIEFQISSLKIQDGPIECIQSTFNESCSTKFQQISIADDNYSKYKNVHVNSEWRTLKICESVIENNTSTIFCGGVVSSLDWSPFEDTTGISYLAVACNNRKITKVTVKSSESYPAFIQVWAVKNLKNEGTLSSNELLYSVSVQEGPIWSIKFYSATNPNDAGKSIGVLAVTTSSGDIYIYSLPLIANQSVLVSLEPLYKLRISEPDDISQTEQPCVVNWSKGNCNDNVYIAAGYKSGFVGVWNFKKFTNSIIQYPISVLVPHSASVTAIDFHYADSLYLMTAGLDRRIKIYSMTNAFPVEISNTVHRTRVLSGEWWINWVSFITGNDECFASDFTTTLKQPHEMYKLVTLNTYDATVMDVSLNHYMNVALVGTDNGDLVSYQLPQLAYFVKGKQFPRTRKYLTLTDYIESEQDEEQLESGIVFYDFKKGACMNQSPIKQSFEKNDFVRINQVCFNRNVSSHKYYAFAYNVGFVRIRKFRNS